MRNRRLQPGRFGAGESSEERQASAKSEMLEPVHGLQALKDTFYACMKLPCRPRRYSDADGGTAMACHVPTAQATISASPVSEDRLYTSKSYGSSSMDVLRLLTPHL